MVSAIGCKGGFHSRSDDLFGEKLRREQVSAAGASQEDGPWALRLFILTQVNFSQGHSPIILYLAINIVSAWTHVTTLLLFLLVRNKTLWRVVIFLISSGRSVLLESRELIPRSEVSTPNCHMLVILDIRKSIVELVEFKTAAGLRFHC
jgi:hypothetical protein